MPTFGNTSSTVADYSNLANYTGETIFTMGSQDGIAKSMSIEVTNQNGDYDHNWKCAIYNLDKTLVASTDAVNKTGTDFEWLTVDFTTNPTIKANTDYYLVACADGGANQAWIGKLSDEDYAIYYGNGAAYAGFPPETLDTETDFEDNYKLCIYCTYDLAGAIGGIIKGNMMMNATLKIKSV